jgi:hypothetical protein
VTLARDHEFTFLDHALKCGDSLVGLTLQQITASHWDTTKPPTFVGKLVSDHLSEAEEGRARIRDHADGATEAELRPLLKAVDAKLEVARLIGDGVIAAFFHSEKPRDRIKRLVEFQTAVHNHLGSQDCVDTIEPFSATLTIGEHPIPAFHWPVEFPEVFARVNGGFDAIVGNPPFAGKNTIIAGHRKNYLPWLQTLHEGAHGNADLVAHFFRRAFGLLRSSGVFGLIATNTIGQGDTRTSGLATILARGGAISRAKRRLKWPGEAAVVVSVVHVVKGLATRPVLDGRLVRRVSAYLVEGNLDTSPAVLRANVRKSFQGSIVLGMGFTFDDAAAAKGEAESLQTMHALIAKDARNAERILPYIGGEEINNDPTQRHRRHVIDFRDFPLRREETATSWELMSDEQRAEHIRVGIVPIDYPYPVAADRPDLLEIVERRVKPQRAVDKREMYRRRWWMYAERRPGLYQAIASLERVLVAPRVSPSPNFVMISNGLIFNEKTIVFAFDAPGVFACLQSRVHECWIRTFTSTLKDDLNYAPSDCFVNFPLPPQFETDASLRAAGIAYHDFRAELMIGRKEGLTKTYNRFHTRGENAPDIAHLRQLHADMDRAVLRAYGWGNLAECAAPQFIDQEVDDGKKPKTRLDWPAEFKDEVLSRLLALNAARAEAERADGVTAVSDADEEEEEIDEEADA